MATGTRTTRGLGGLAFGSGVFYENDFSAGSALSNPDPVDGNVQVRLFDDTVDENIGLELFYVPVGATGLDITIIHRGVTSQTGAQTVDLDWATVPDTGSPGAADFTLTIDIPNADVTWQYQTFSVDLSSTNWIAGEPGQASLTVDASDSTITGDWAFRAMLVEFY